MAKKSKKSLSKNSEGKVKNHKSSHSDKKGKKKKGTAKNFAPQTLIGVLETTTKGFGFVIVEGQAEDIFIASSKRGEAMHGDLVEVLLISNNKGGGEGEIVRVLERKNQNVVGTFYKKRPDNFDGSHFREFGKGFGLCIPDDTRIARDILISGDFLGANHLDKVVVKITKTCDGFKPEGKIVEVLGNIEDKGVDILSIIRSYNLYETFPKSVENEAKNVAVEVTKEQKKDRADYTDELVITIDGDDSRDFDDAVSLKQKSNGNFKLSVHIADVSHYVRANSKLDKEAFKRGTSVYFVDRVLPMLPEKLSNDICSLNEGKDRLVLSCIMEIEPNSGKIVKSKLKEGVIKSQRRMTYSKVAKILDGDAVLRAEYFDIVAMLESMKSLAQTLYNKRSNRGNIEFDITESDIILDKDGKIAEIRKKPRLISHRIIEEFMLAANETVAETMFNKKAPFIYRAHDEPPAEKVEALTEFLEAMGLEFEVNCKKPLPSDFSKLLSGLDDEHKGIVNKITLRTMSKAAYEPINKGHFGLAAEYYCHFTSPIRRYPDLVIHRIIKDYLHSGESCFDKYRNMVADAAKNSSERERLAEKAERDVDDLKKAEYMQDKIGQQFDGIISGVTEWGVFVELENSVEGLIRVEDLPGDSYEYNPKLHRLSNKVNSFAIGKKISIVVVGINGSRVMFEYKT